MDNASPRFEKAKPIWPADREKEKNLTVGFRSVVGIDQIQKVMFCITASSIYRFYLNGEFIGNGPATSAHQYFRVDEWDLTDKVKKGNNVIAVEVVGYNVNSFYLLDQPAFLQAELSVNGIVKSATSVKRSNCEEFEAYILTERIQKVPRYSLQRPFMEAYRLKNGFDRWKINLEFSNLAEICNELPEKKLLPRGVKYAKYRICRPSRMVSENKIKRIDEIGEYWEPCFYTTIGPTLKGYSASELDIDPIKIAQHYVTLMQVTEKHAYYSSLRDALNQNHERIMDFGNNLSGFIGINFRCAQHTKILITFDEIMTEENINYKRIECANILYMEVEPGSYKFQSMEPYTLRYLKIQILEESCSIGDIYLMEYANSDIESVHFQSSNMQINKIFKAGVETFRQNSVDNFTDCPSRERAGWLCDSFFTSRVAKLLTGNTLIENNFFENFLLPESFSDLPQGMLPMCYPADPYKGLYIPNFGLWFVLQLEEYATRGGKASIIEGLESKAADLFAYYEKYLNEDGLLERLEGWIFVEWSKANDWVQDVNYPTNMLYAGALSAAGRMYKREEWIQQAEQIRETIYVQSFSGDFFADHAMRNRKQLIVLSDKSEICQYYAFYFNLVNPTTHPELWNKLVSQFGPDRKQTLEYSDVSFSSPLNGNYLRMELLSQYNKSPQLLDEAIDYFYVMAEQTGTLWEHDSPAGSCNHGFASHIIHVFYRDLLGLYKIDTISKRLIIKFYNHQMEHCEGKVPVEEGVVELSWRKENNLLYYSLKKPSQYHVEIVNMSGLALVEL